jgi:hypothetical protein
VGYRRFLCWRLYDRRHLFFEGPTLIKYEPSKLIKKIAPEKKLKKLLNKNLTLKKAALSFTSDADVLSKKSIERVALKTIKGYKARIKDDPSIKGELLADPKQLVQRVQNEVVTQIADEIKTKYNGEFYVWLPSDADEPDPEHQLNYGKTFQIGDGEMPGDRYGCKCGMQILVDDSSLDI